MHSFICINSSATSTLAYFFSLQWPKKKIIAQRLNFHASNTAPPFRMLIPAWIFLPEPATAPTARQHSPFLARGLCDLSWCSGHVLLMLTLRSTAQPPGIQILLFPSPLMSENPVAVYKQSGVGTCTDCNTVTEMSHRDSDAATNDPEKDELGHTGPWNCQRLLQHREQGQKSISMPPCTLVGISTRLFLLHLDAVDHFSWARRWNSDKHTGKG